MTERKWDQKLNINTIGRDASVEDVYHHSYEPTPYSVLERLIESEYIKAENVVVDYGCGKGRVEIFLNSQLGCKCIGVEYDKKICGQAEENYTSYSSVMKKRGKQGSGDKKVEDARVKFECVSAENYEIYDADTFYFFNPFSVEILKSVLGKIKQSYYARLREMKLYFYYPSDEYVSYLMTVPELCFLDEIDCSDLFEENQHREKILIFEMGSEIID